MCGVGGRPEVAVDSQNDAMTPSSGDTTYPVPSIEVTAQEQNMNAPPNIDSVTTLSDSDVLHWLTNDTRDVRFIDSRVGMREFLLAIC
jgi:adenylate cyclase